MMDENTIDTNESEAPVSAPNEKVQIEKPEREDKDVKHRTFKTALKANLKEGSETIKEKITKNGEQPRESSKGTAFAQPDTPREQTQLQTQERIAIAPPVDMTPEEKEFFSKADPATQTYLSRLHLSVRQQHNQYTTQRQELEKKYGSQLKEVQDISQTVTPEVRDEYTRMGIQVPDVIRRSIAWDKSHRTRGGESMREYIEAYGISPQQIYPELFGGQSNYKQPQQEEQNYLTREDAERLADERAQDAVNKKFEALQQEQIAHNNFGHVQSFLKSKPLFRDPGTAHQLEEEMAPVVAALKQRNPSAQTVELLETAYNYVTKGNPVFSGLVQQLNAKQEVDKSQQVALKAKEAGKSIHGSPGSGSPKQVQRNFRESLAKNLRS